MATREKRSKKSLLALLILLLAIAIIVGTSLAFFSDIISGSIGGTAGTLDLVKSDVNSKQFFAREGIAEVQDLDVNNINPGDYILVDFNATNAGNKSAWVRNVLSEVEVTLNEDIQSANSTFTMTNAEAAEFFTLYKAPTAAELTSAGYADLDIFLLSVVGGDTAAATLMESLAVDFASAQDGKVAEAAVILNGTGTSAEIETGTNVVEEAPVQYIIAFDKDATNELQGAEVTFGIEVQAIQYRNNTNPEWSTVVTEEFTLVP